MSKALKLTIYPFLNGLTLHYDKQNWVFIVFFALKNIFKNSRASSEKWYFLLFFLTDRISFVIFDFCFHRPNVIISFNRINIHKNIVNDSIPKMRFFIWMSSFDVITKETVTEFCLLQWQVKTGESAYI